MTTLYRKYRPQAFSDLTGQEHIVQTVINEIALGTVAHAYLFSGPRGVGKTTLARLLAKAVNCPNRKKDASEPCGKCSSCTEIAAGRNIDVIEIDAASHTGVDNVRENIIENAQFKPTKSPYKVFIIDEVHMLSTSAFNALLKTLEEPPAHVMFVLATTELHKLPATVISRCQRFNFKKIPYDLMHQRLKKLCEEETVKVAKEVLERIINKSDGCLRDAESLLGQILSLGKKNISVEDAELILPSPSHETVIEFLEHLANKDAKPALKLIDSLQEKGINLDQFAYDTIEMLRALMILQATGGNEVKGEYSDGVFKRMKKLGTAFSPASVTHLIDRALARRLEIKAAPIPQLPLELLVVESTINLTPSSQGGTRGVLDGITAAETPPTVPSLGGEGKPPPSPIRGRTEEGVETSTHSLTATIKQALSHFTHDEPIKTTLEQIKERWKDIVIKMSAGNPSLTFILTNCTLQAVTNNTLQLLVPFAIHKDKLEEKKNKQAIEKILEEMFGEAIHCNCIIAEQQKTSELDLTNLAVEFGGEIVN